MKKTPLTVRRCPPELHEALKKSAAVNHRSLNGETLTWLEKQASQQKKVCTAKDLAAALRKFEKLTTAAERREMAEGIELARKRMNREHLH